MFCAAYVVVSVSYTCSGSVIGPTFQFDVPMLKFGTVSYGRLQCDNQLFTFFSCFVSVFLAFFLSSSAVCVCVCVCVFVCVCVCASVVAVAAAAAAAAVVAVVVVAG